MGLSGWPLARRRFRRPKPPKPEPATALVLPPAPPIPLCAAGLHRRIADNRWFVAGVELCRQCGRDAVADYLARKEVGRG